MLLTTHNSPLTRLSSKIRIDRNDRRDQENRQNNIFCIPACSCLQPVLWCQSREGKSTDLCIIWWLCCITYYQEYNDANDGDQKTIILEENIIYDPEK
jgi:hypothetical protein